MAEFNEDAKAFARVVAALKPYLGDLVFVGGWAHRVLALHDLASPLDFQPLATEDTDIAAPLRMQVRGTSMREGGKVALRVASAVNSRVILDAPGAENLLGRGDLLADLGQGLVRAQAAMVAG